MEDRSLLFDKFLDNIELYFDYKKGINAKVKSLVEQGTFDYHEALFPEYEMLDNLRELARRALDQYVLSDPHK